MLLMWLLDRCYPDPHALHPRSGPSGMVQLAFNRETQEQVAIKFLLRGNTFNAPSIVRELQNHRLCHLHPHIVPLRVRRL